MGLVPYGSATAISSSGANATRAIATNLRGSRLTLLYGASGVGKSSLLLAGVVHGCERGADRGGPAEPAPFAVCASAVARGPGAGAGRGAAPGDRGGVAEASCRRGAARSRWSPPCASGRCTCGTALLILDQFEEYFLYHPDEHGPGSFAGALAEIVDDADLHVHVLISLREDALSRLDQFKATIPGLFSNYLRVDHLDRPSARERSKAPSSRGVAGCRRTRSP